MSLQICYNNLKSCLGPAIQIGGISLENYLSKATIYVGFLSELEKFSNKSKPKLILREKKTQRTNGPVNAHLISWPSKAQNIQNLENIWYRNNLDLQYSHTFIISISCLHLPTFRSQAAIVSEKSTVFTFSHRKA